MTNPYIDENSFASLYVQRKLTHELIRRDGRGVALVPRNYERDGGGARIATDGTPRAVQQFKFVGQGLEFNGMNESGDGRQRQYQFILIAAWNAIIEIGDHWRESDGSHWEVSGSVADNGYERKFGCYAYGKSVRV